MSKGMKPSSKAVLGVSTVTRLETRAESQSMKIELRRPTVCSSASAAGGKSWGLNHLLLPNISCSMQTQPGRHSLSFTPAARVFKVLCYFHFAPVCFSWSCLCMSLLHSAAFSSPSSRCRLAVARESFSSFAFFIPCVNFTTASGGFQSLKHCELFGTVYDLSSFVTGTKIKAIYLWTKCGNAYVFVFVWALCDSETRWESTRNKSSWLDLSHRFQTSTAIFLYCREGL